jgi:hypothetical protein
MHVRSLPRRVAPALALHLAGAALAPTTLHAQDTDADRLVRSRDPHWGGRGERHCEVRVTRLRAPTRTIAVDGRENGAVEIDGWDRDSLVIHARIQAQAPTEQEARELAGQVRVETSGPTIRADGPPSSRDRSWWVGYVISTPRRSDLSVETHNGPISVHGVRGRMELRAVNGPVELRDVGGDVRGRTDNGPLVIDLRGERWDGRGLDAETMNGPVNLTLPARYSARLETGTVNGPMSIHYPMTLQGRIGRRITTELGAGGPPVRAITTNGPVTIEQQ